MAEPEDSRAFTAAKAVFFLLVASLAWQQPFPRIFGLPLTPFEVVFPFAAAAWLAFRVRGRLGFDGFHVLAASYLVAVAFASLFSPQPAASFVKLIGIAELVLTAVIAFDLVRAARNLKHVTYTWLATAAVPIAVALASFVVFYAAPDCELLRYTTYHHGAAPAGNYPRLSSTFVSAGMFCSYLTVTLAIAFVARVRRWVPTSAAVGMSAIVAVIGVLTVSIPVGGLALAAGLILWKTLGPDRRTLGTLALVGGLAGAGLFAALSLQSRSAVWLEAVATIAAHPLAGAGLDMPVARVLYQNSDGTTSLLTDAHNSFLSIWAQNGVLAVAAFSALCFLVVKRAMRSKDEAVFIMLAAFVSAVIYNGLAGSFEDARHLWLLTGLLAGVSTRADPAPDDADSTLAGA